MYNGVIGESNATKPKQTSATNNCHISLFEENKYIFFLQVIRILNNFFSPNYTKPSYILVKLQLYHSASFLINTINV